MAERGLPGRGRFGNADTVLGLLPSRNGGTGEVTVDVLVTDKHHGKYL
jgi:hypothetical protein